MSRSPRHAGLELTLLHRYLFFLSRRPISVANRHYLDQRLAGLRALAVQSREQGPSEASDVRESAPSDPDIGNGRSSVLLYDVSPADPSATGLCGVVGAVSRAISSLNAAPDRSHKPRSSGRARNSLGPGDGCAVCAFVTNVSSLAD